jgi:Lon protease-like protein
MSEVFDKVIGINQLPIFSLPIVLFPSELLPLHIFEDRYRKMLKDIEFQKNLFGLNYFNPQDSDYDFPEIGSIGCVAEVREVDMLEDGRSNILTVGIIRYEIKGYVETVEPYLVAEVEYFDDFEEDETQLNLISDEVFNIFRRIAKAAHEITNQRKEFPDIPQAEPKLLSFLVAAAFQLENDVRYDLLKTRSTVERLKKLREVLVDFVDKIEESAKMKKLSTTNGHSKKKIDFE